MPKLLAENLKRHELERASSSRNFDSPQTSPTMTSQKAVEKGPEKVVKIQPTKPVDNIEPELSAMPDPLKPKWHDCCYYAGESCFHRLPLLHDAVEAIAPDTILEPKGALEKTCGFVLFGQLIVVLAYIYFALTGYRGCTEIRFLSLVQTETYCVEVKNAINDKFSVDDNGYWDTFYEWSFAESMCGANFIDFETTDTDWLKYSKGMWKIFDTWNTKWSAQTSVDNLMAMVVSEEAVPGKQLLLAHVLADPIALMNTNFKDVIAVNNQKDDGAFILNYGDLDKRIYLSAARSKWNEKLPKWKFAANTLDDALSGDDGDDPDRGVMINKYSLWVAAAINMGIIELKDLTKLTETSLTSAYSVTNDDGDDSGDDNSVSGTASSCSIPSYYADGYCDSVNNVAACDYDGGDCCESTCGVTYEPDVDCGTAGYNCQDPDASDFGSSDVITYDDDAFDDGFTGGGYYYSGIALDDAGAYYSGGNCIWYDILLLDSACDGWEGNYLHIGTDHKFTLEEGCNGTQYVCLETGNTYKPYACGGNYPSEISWVISSFSGTTVWDDDNVEVGDDDSLYKVGGGSALCDWEYCGSVTIVVGSSAVRRLTEEEQKKATPPQMWEKMTKHGSRRKLQATPSPSVSLSPSVAPTIAATSPEPTTIPPSSLPTPSPTHAPTVDYYYNFGLTDYVLFKYYEEMDPIQCAHVNGSQYCWVKGNAGEKGTEDENLGAYLFPIIQHYDKDCYNCSSTAANNDDDCNDVDLEVLLFFNPKLVSQPHFVHTYNASYQEERRKYDLDNAGLDGLIYLNMYGGVKYLNELFYAMPDTHCTKPIAIAKGVKTKNSLACGTKYQQGLLSSKKKSIKKTAQKSFCQNTPTAPQERYFECRYSPQECVSTAIAEASGQTALVASVMTLLIVFWAVHFLGVPKSQRAKAPDVDVSETGFFGSMAMKAKGLCQSANDARKEAEEKKKANKAPDGEDGDIEMSSKQAPINMSQMELALEEEEEVTLESLQEEIMKQKIAQEAKVEELNAKIDKLLSAQGLSDSPPVAVVAPVSNAESENEATKQFTPSATPTSTPKDSYGMRVNHGSISKTNQADL